MTRRLKVLGIVLALIGLGFIVGGGVAYAKVQAGYDSLKAFSGEQNVELTYNDSGELADGEGSTEEATAIMALLTDDWKYPVVESDLDPNDPVVNTASEYMYQMATVNYHTLTGEQTVVLPEDVTADDGKVYKAGTYQFAPEGRYWSGYRPLEPDRGRCPRAGLDRHAHTVWSLSSASERLPTPRFSSVWPSRRSSPASAGRSSSPDWVCSGQSGRPSPCCSRPRPSSAS